MEASAMQIEREICTTHWWHRNRREIFQTLLRQFFHQEQIQEQNPNKELNSAGSRPKKYKILEVGCGPGENLPILAEFGSIEGAESNEEAFQFLKKKHSQYKIFHHSIPENLEQHYDMICILDVLEHVEETEAVKWLARHLNPNGLVLVSVPAFSFLWSSQDVQCHHKKRYTHSSLIKTMDPYFKKERLSYYNFIFFPLIVVFNAIDRFLDWLLRRDPLKKRNRVFTASGNILNQIFYQIMHLEVHILKYSNFPIGASLVGIFRKKG